MTNINTPNKLYLSIGENCLTDGILKRHNFKGFSTIYSHCRSNMDYVISLEKTSYASLLDINELEYSYVGETKVVRHKKINEADMIYSSMHTKGFEFTHHDVISNEIHRDSFLRKIQRLKDIKGKKDICFFYHYRLDKNNDVKSLLDKAENFIKFYSINGASIQLIIFTQEIIGEDKSRELIHHSYNEEIEFFTFKTRAVWGGNDPNLLWAKTDDDLIKEMLLKVTE